jgi:hypothetical protein
LFTEFKFLNEIYGEGRVSLNLLVEGVSISYMAAVGNCRLIHLQFVIDNLAWKRGFLVIAPVPYGSVIDPDVR